MALYIGHILNASLWIFIWVDIFLLFMWVAATMGRIRTPDDIPDWEDMIPEKIYVDQEAYDKLLDMINNPPQPSEALKDLFRNTNNDFSSGEKLGGK